MARTQEGRVRNARLHANYPSTMLRMVPLPTGFAGREADPSKRAGAAETIR